MMPCLGMTGELGESKQLEWKIPNFLSLSAIKNQFYRSPPFSFAGTSLCLTIYPMGYSRYAEDGFMSVFVEHEVGNRCDLNVFYSFHIKKADGTLTEDANYDEVIGWGLGHGDFYARSSLEQNKTELLPSGSLTIVCILKLSEDGEQTIASEEENLSKAQKVSDRRRFIEINLLSKNLKDLLSAEDSCDAVLLVQEKKFKVHKSILIARSTVFAAMFRHDTVEKQTGEVTIPDCDPDSFHSFLEYLYCGRLEDISGNSALHLYRTSDKYNVQELKSFCVEYLQENLTIQIICDVVSLADEYDEANLFSSAQKFFNNNIKEIFVSKEWENLFRKNFRLANKLLVEMSNAVVVK